MDAGLQNGLRTGHLSLTIDWVWSVKVGNEKGENV